MIQKISGTAPQTKLPTGSIDTHMHIYDPLYPSQAGGPDSPSDFAGIKEYEEVQKWLALERVVVVQANAHQANNDCVLNALNMFGDISRGIACITPDMPLSTLNSYHQQGVRAARIMELGGAVRLNELLAVNQLITPLNWSMIVQFDGNQILEHAPLLEKIEGDYVLDHHGKFFEPITTDSAEFKRLLTLIDRGNCYVKLAGCYETSKKGFPHYQDIAQSAKALIDYAPERIIWGSNWPHVMKQPDKTPCDAALLDTVCNWIPNSSAMQKIFVENPAKLYGF